MNRKLNFFYYLFGCFIPLLVLFSHFEIVEENSVIFLTILIVSIIIGVLKYNKKIHIIILLIVCILVVLNFQSIFYSIIHIYNSIVKEYNELNGVNLSDIDIYIDKNTIFTHIWYFAILLQSLISLFMKRYNKKQKYGKLFIFTLIFALPIILIQIDLDWISWILMITYWVLLYIINFYKYTINQNNMIKMPILVICVLSLSCLIFTNNFTETELKRYYNPVTIQQDIVDKINELIDSISQHQSNSNEVNLMDAKDRVYANTKHLEVQTSHIESMYLKYYSGSLYFSNTWTSLEEDDYNGKDKFLDKSFNWITQFTFNDKDVDEVIIKDFRKGNTFSLYPYYMRSVDKKYDRYFDMYMTYPSKEATFQVWNIENVKINNQKSFDYIRFVNENYKYIPNNIESLFKYQLSLPKETLTISEATSKIQSLLREYVYTLSPGATPEDEDFVDYFLTENKKGYCVHFASAATLMFRYYGVPARYVEGYHVSSSQFDKNGVAIVVDKDSHSWVEVFDRELGWTPVEVTVGQDEFEDEREDEPINPTRPNYQQNQNNQNTQNNNNNNQPNLPVVNPLVPNNQNQMNFEKIIKDYIYLFVIIGLFVGYFIYRRIRIRIRKIQINNTNRKESVYAMYRYLDKVNQYSNIMDDTLIEIFEKNKFSKNGLDQNEYQKLKNIVETIPKQIYSTLKFKNKLKYKYIDCLI